MAIELTDLKIWAIPDSLKLGHALNIKHFKFFRCVDRAILYSV